MYNLIIKINLMLCHFDKHLWEFAKDNSFYNNYSSYQQRGAHHQVLL